MENYYRGESSTLQDAGWAGFCDKATILSSLYELIMLEQLILQYNLHVYHP